MFKTNLKGLWAHKRRLVGTSLAVLLGIMFLTGILVLGDTLRASFDDAFAEANEGTALVVRPVSAIDGADANPAAGGLLDQSIVEEVGAVDGVGTVAPVVEAYGRIVGADGEPLGGGGPPTLAGNWITEPGLNPYDLIEGRAPEADGEVVINEAAPDGGDLAVGDTTIVQTPEPIEVTIVGLARFGSSGALGGVTFAGFTLESAQQNLTGLPGELTSISVAAAPGTTEEELAPRVGEVLPEGAEAITGTALAAESVSDINDEFLGVFTTFLVVFAGIALLVATFSIYNTFSILVAQRGRESALLRALGASRRQVVTSVAVEALAVGVVASLIGILAGLGVAAGLQALLDAADLGFPSHPLVFTGGTAVLSLVVGLVVTLLAAVAPAVRASRVSPMAALAEVAVDRTDASRARAILGTAVTALGVAAVLIGVISTGDGVLAAAGLGAVGVIVGGVTLGPVVARPRAGVLGSPLPVGGGIPGWLARGNAMRNPRRTAGTASALMVGIGVVALFTVFAASLTESVDQAVSESFGGDLVIAAEGFGEVGFSPGLASDVGGLEEVSVAVGLGGGEAPIGGDDERFTAANPGALAAVADLDVVEGSLEELGEDRFAVSEVQATEQGWTVGTTVDVTYADGATDELTVAAVYDDRNLVGDHLLTPETTAPHTVQALDMMVFIDLAGGVSLAEGKAAVAGVANSYGAEVQDRDEFVTSVASGVDQMLAVVYALLALAIIIALMGIANTLSLSIHERTRELGLLRAVGETRGQLRSMVRWESVIISTFGTVGGLGLGVFLGWALVRAASSAEQGLTTFALPVGSLVVVLVAGAVVGVVAGLRPARRGARLDVLRAIAAE